MLERCWGDLYKGLEMATAYRDAGEGCIGATECVKAVEMDK